MESEKGRGREESRNSQENRPRGSSRRSQLVREEGPQQLSKRYYTVAKPSAVAKPAGTPNSLIVTGLAVGTRAFRASRSAHERREWARWGRERITSTGRGDA